MYTRFAGSLLDCAIANLEGRYNFGKKCSVFSLQKLWPLSLISIVAQG